MQLPARFPRSLVAGFLVLGLVTVAYIASSIVIQPRFSDGYYRLTPAPDLLPFNFPLAFESHERVIPIEFSFSLKSIHATRYIFSADDCIQDMQINGREVYPEIMPLCDFDRGFVLNLGSYIHSGQNDVRMNLKNVGGPGGLSFTIADSDLLLFALRTALVLSILSVVFLLFYTRKLSMEPLVFLGLATGIAVRFIYLCFTSYVARGHDPDGHIEYITYIAQHLSLPAVKTGWEFYQPPLYYVFSGLWMRLANVLGYPTTVVIRQFQWHAFFASVICLAIGAWIGKMLFPGKNERLLRALFIWILALFPSLVYFSARVNNDVFLALWEFLILAYFLSWWQKGRLWDWIFCIFFSSLAILTKSNALLLLPLLFLGLLIRKDSGRWMMKTLIGGLSFFFLLAVIVWNVTYRGGGQDDNVLVANLSNIDMNLLVDYSAETLAEFNPLRIVLHPFNDPWSDSQGRQYFWEYVFRSSLFGEFSFAPRYTVLCILMLSVFLLLLPVAVIGAWASFRWQWYKTFPVWMSALLVLGGHAAYREIAPYASSQDFRYSILFVLPLAFFLVFGWNRLTGWTKVVSSHLLLLFLVLSGSFLLSISILG